MRNVRVPYNTLAESDDITEPATDNFWKTDVWPLNGYTVAANKANDNYLQTDRKIVDGKAWARKGTNHGWRKDGGSHAGYTGVGYARNADRATALGTPGYDNGAMKSDGADATANAIITEIMYADDGDIERMPQWIEITNPSTSVSVNLHNFRLSIVNHDRTYAEGESGDTATAEWEGKLDASFLLKGLSIQPRQSVLIATINPTGRDVKDVYLPDADIFVVWNNNDAKAATGMTKLGHPIINPYGFYITLHAKASDLKKPQDWQLADTVGNLAAPSTDRRGNRQPFDPIAWALPNPVDEDGVRSSVVRTNTTTNISAGGFTRALVSGTEASGWMLTSMDPRTNRIAEVYYGDITDISTPGQTVRSPLPVSLSYFRPTLENGEVVIRWTTQSELDNAGFNILRGDSRDGEFKQVNSELVQGAGTTGERNTYKWVDESAKPGVIYYYQIEDVSFAGEHQTLTTTKLKGLISAKNKLTTLWGGLKEVQ